MAGLLLGLAREAGAQFSETLFRAGDGTAYQVLRAVPPLGIGAEQTRVTTVSGSSTGVGGCNISESMSGGLAAAIAGVLPPGQTLHPFNQVIRTGILVPDNVDIDHFFPSFGGRVQLGTSNADCTAAGAPSACCTGAGTGTCAPLNVCHAPASDCLFQPNVQALAPLSSATGGIPAACVANGVSAGTQCDGTNTRNVFAFGLPATNNVCNTPANVTAHTTVCAPPPADGFTLSVGQAVIFIYNTSLLGLGFSPGAAGFGIDTDGMNTPGCMMNQVVGADTRLDSFHGGGTPSPTPSGTPTETPTLTPTPVLAGMVRYYAQDRPVPGVDVTLLGGGVTSTTTDAGGTFAFATVSSVPHLLAPAKQDDVNAAVTALDAAYVLQRVVGLRTFNADQSLACDVTGNGTVSALDAVRILQFQAELIDRFAVADLCGSNWGFRPMPGPAENQILVQPQISDGTCQQGGIGYNPFVSSADAQDFIAALFGDCTGNWRP